MQVIHRRSVGRVRRHLRIRRRMEGTLEKPRLTVFRSHKHLYAQMINDLEGKTLLTVSTLSPLVREKVKYGGNVKAAEALGEILAEEAKKSKIQNVIFDRSGYRYHGRIRALADAARKGGLVF
ncbi:MAG: 50S ribosomal protein L18 [Chlamydiae bacterium]|nr:50S ribosomal protein L18 [Chlamydiota bacterium]